MKSKIIKLGAVLTFAASSLYADISNTNSVIWNGGTYAINTSYNWTGDPLNVLGLQVTVGTGYKFDFNSMGIFLGYSGGGLGGAPSPYLRIVDSLSSVVATTPTVLMTTPANGFYSIDSRTAANPYEMILTPASTVTLNPGTYTFQIWDTGEQLQYMYNAGSASVVGLTVSAGGGTPAFWMSGNVGPVPEPSTWALMGMGMFGLFLARRARRSKA